MSGLVVGWAFQVGREKSLTPNERYVLVAVADNSDDNGFAWPSMETLIDKTGLGRSSVYRAMKRLRQLELIGWGTSPVGTKCFALAVPTQSLILGLAEDDESHGGTPKSHTGIRSNKGTVNEPSEQQQLDSGISQNETAAVWSHYCKAMNRKSHLVLEDRTRRVIRDALKVATVEEVCCCVDACAGSDYHMKRGRHASRNGGRYNTVGQILKPKPTKGESQRDRIDWWLEYAGEDRGGRDEYGWSEEDRSG